MVVIIFPSSFVEIYPREGTETYRMKNSFNDMLLKFIPVRGRKLFLHIA